MSLIVEGMAMSKEDFYLSPMNKSKDTTHFYQNK